MVLRYRATSAAPPCGGEACLAARSPADGQRRGKPRPHKLLLVGAALVFVATAVALADDAPRPFALTGCRVVTGSGADIASGIVVVKDGRIDSVGPWTKGQEPAGVEVIDATGQVLTPSFVHPATRLGMRDELPGGDDTIEPTRTAQTELNPWLAGNAWAAANGFATLGLLPGRGIVGGRGVAVRAAAPSIEAMVRRDDAFLRCDVAGNPKFTGALSSVLADARKEVDAQTAWDKAFAEFTAAKAKAEAEKQPAPKEPEKPKLEPSREAYRKVLRGETALLLTVDGSGDAHLAATALADERVRGRALRLYVLCGGDSYRAAGELADLGATCLVRAGIALWPNSTDRICPAVLFRNAGCRVVLLPRDDSRAGLRDFPFALAQTVRAGFARDDVFRAVAASPAEMLGLAADTGSIEKGRRADLVLWSADPLGAAPRIERVWIDGQRVEETP
jgi:imidazolonepropionase-like amidohydrolase